jgi:hypothetical protein
MGSEGSWMLAFPYPIALLISSCNFTPDGSFVNGYFVPRRREWTISQAKIVIRDCRNNRQSLPFKDVFFFMSFFMLCSISFSEMLL